MGHRFSHPFSSKLKPSRHATASTCLLIDIWKGFARACLYKKCPINIYFHLAMRKGLSAFILPSRQGSRASLVLVLHSAAWFSLLVALIYQRPVLQEEDREDGERRDHREQRLRSDHGRPGFPSAELHRKEGKLASQYQRQREPVKMQLHGGNPAAGCCHGTINRRATFTHCCHGVYE